MPLPPTSAPASAAPAARAMAGVPRMYMLLLAAWIFDFQSEGEGQGVAIQAYFAAAYLFALMMMLIGDRAVGKRISGLTALMICGAIYLGVGIASGIIHGQSIYPILRNAFTVAIYLSTAFVTARVMQWVDPARLRSTLAVFCLLYAVSTYLVIGQIGGEVDLDRARYQIVGASAVAALGYVVLAALFKLSKIEMAAMAINGVIVLLSITRTFLLVLFTQALVFVGQVRRVFSPRLIAVGVLGLVALVGVLTFGERQVVRWQERITGSGSSTYIEYQTVYTRLSEWEFMLSDWTKSTDNFLIGSGIAARTTYFKSRELGGGSDFMVGFGHNQHLSMPFTAGAVGGLPLLFLQFFQAWLAWRFLRQTIRSPHLRSDAVFLGAWGAAIVLGYFALNLVSPTFAVRAMSLWFGVGTGLLLGAQALFDPINRPSRAPPTQPRGSGGFAPRSGRWSGSEPAR